MSILIVSLKLHHYYPSKKWELETCTTASTIKTPSSGLQYGTTPTYSLFIWNSHSDSMSVRIHVSG